MAMVGNDMGDSVVTAFELIDPTMTADQISQLRSSWRATCNAIVTYIQAHADVLPIALSGPPLSNPSGQPSSGSDPQGGIVASLTTAPMPITGKGSIS